MSKEKKKISVMIPCYNEEENVVPISEAVVDILNKELPEYDYEILFIDNCSTDKTRDLLRAICSQNKKIRAILNARNFGQFNSPYYGLCQTTGDCTISLCCDFQDPVELIPVFVHEWEKGYKIVSGIKTSSKENRFIYFLRTVYYKLIKNMSSVDMIEHFTGFGLYDKDFIQLLRDLEDPIPFIRGVVAEFGYKRKEIEYEQPKRRAGKTHNNFYSLYDAAMLSFTSYTKVGLRLASFVGYICAFFSFVVGIVYFVQKLLHWNDFSAGMAPLVIGLFFLSGIELIFIGFLGEYVMNINQRVMNRPLVIEEERINFETDQSD
ncbi:MAG: glycosyltransferase family 2 protein [Lachnospiraceae bacterium]|nr:glycosyltransferase family 2 protein [Lachnospiraceae bacterium]